MPQSIKQISYTNYLCYHRAIFSLTAQEQVDMLPSKNQALLKLCYFKYTTIVMNIQ